MYTHRTQLMHLRARHAGHRQDVATDAEADEEEEEVFEWPVCHLEDRGLWDRLMANLQDEWATLTVFIMSSLVVHIDTFVALAVAVVSPLFFFYYRLPGGSMMAYNQSWTLVSVLLVFPITMTLTSVFQRREEALRMLARLKANLHALYLAHAHWDWPVVPKDPALPPITGRGRLPPNHVENVYEDIRVLLRTMRTFLMAPTVTRARNFYTRPGRRERQLVQEHARALLDRVTARLSSLSLLVEELKAAGMPANEATRIRLYFLNITTSLHQLRMIKAYRTPVGLRVFSRVFTIMLPALFGPYYANMAVSTHIAFSLCFSVVICIALLGLFNLRFALEDPFNGLAVDGVDLHTEVTSFEMMMRMVHSAESGSAHKAAQSDEPASTSEPDVQVDIGAASAPAVAPSEPNGR